MKNVRLFQLNGVSRLYDLEGQPVDIFNRFSKHLADPMLGLARQTQDAYCRNTAQFVDYLVECGFIFQDRAPSIQALRDCIKEYILILSQGINSDTKKIREIAISLSRSPLRKSSRQQHIAAVKKFLNYCDLLAQETQELAKLIGLEEIYLGAPIWKQNKRSYSEHEKSAMIASSLISGNLASCASYKSNIRGVADLDGDDYDGNHFPPIYIQDLLDAATNARDETLWCLLAGGGLRQTEALALQTGLIFPSKRILRVEDPNNIRGSNEYVIADKLPWKGRNTAKVYIYEPLKERFFQAYERYLRIKPSSHSPFVFKTLSRLNYGENMIELLAKSRSLNGSMNESFRKAISRVNDKYGREAVDPRLSIHSLRHSYGHYLLNFHYIPGRSRPGLQLHEVQLLMGHASPQTTKKYAQIDIKRFENELAAADELLSGDLTKNDIRRRIASSYRLLAESIELGND